MWCLAYYLNMSYLYRHSTRSIITTYHIYTNVVPDPLSQYIIAMKMTYHKIIKSQIMLGGNHQCQVRKPSTSQESLSATTIVQITFISNLILHINIYIF